MKNELIKTSEIPDGPKITEVEKAIKQNISLE